MSNPNIEAYEIRSDLARRIDGVQHAYATDDNGVGATGFSLNKELGAVTHIVLTAIDYINLIDASRKRLGSAGVFYKEYLKEAIDELGKGLL